MRDSIRKFTTGRNEVIDFRAVTCPTTKTFMLLDKQIEVTEGSFDSEVLRAAKPDPLPTFSLQVLTPMPDTTEAGEVKATSWKFKRRTAGFFAS